MNLKHIATMNTIKTTLSHTKKLETLVATKATEKFPLLNINHCILTEKTKRLYAGSRS